MRFPSHKQLIDSKCITVQILGGHERVKEETLAKSGKERKVAVKEMVYLGATKTISNYVGLSCSLLLEERCLEQGLKYRPMLICISNILSGFEVPNTM